MRSARRTELALAGLLACAPAHADDPPGDASRGEVLAGLGGCAACHTADDGAPYAGGHAVVTRFGTFHGSNLTADPEHGLGRWTYEDFARAMREGRAPDGRAYWPAFPYPAFTGLVDADLADLWAYLRTLPPDPTPEVPHAVRPVYDHASSLALWRSFGFRPGPWVAKDPEADAAWSRGAYLVRTIGHCGECHTPRGATGVPRRRRELAGSDDPRAPNLTPHPDGLGGWSEADLAEFLVSGTTAEGDVVGGHMGRVVELGTARLDASDRAAIVTFLRALPARPSR